MARKTMMKNHETGMSREVKEGFSWTVFFFSFIALLVRKQYTFAAVAFGINILLSGLNVISMTNPDFPNLSFLGIIVAIFYGEQANKRLKKQLLSEGYVATN